MTVYERLRAAVGDINGLTDKQLEQHVRGVERVVKNAKRRTRNNQKQAKA